MDESRVMGPDGDLAPDKHHDFLRPPYLTPTTDTFKWRKQVALWATMARRFAKGGDKRAKEILSALRLTLFNALDSVFASKVERAITAGILCLDLDEEDDQDSVKQNQVVQDIIEIVAKSPLQTA